MRSFLIYAFDYLKIAPLCSASIHLRLFIFGQIVRIDTSLGLTRAQWIIVFVAGKTRPINGINAHLMAIADERVITKACDFLAILSKVRKAKVFAIVYYDLEALIVDQCPKAHVTFLGNMGFIFVTFFGPKYLNLSK